MIIIHISLEEISEQVDKCKKENKEVHSLKKSKRDMERQLAQEFSESFMFCVLAQGYFPSYIVVCVLCIGIVTMMNCCAEHYY